MEIKEKMERQKARKKAKEMNEDDVSDYINRYIDRVVEGGESPTSYDKELFETYYRFRIRKAIEPHHFVTEGYIYRILKSFARGIEAEHEDRMTFGKCYGEICSNLARAKIEKKGNTDGE